MWTDSPNMPRFQPGNAQRGHLLTINLWTIRHTTIRTNLVTLRESTTELAKNAVD